MCTPCFILSLSSQPVVPMLRNFTFSPCSPEQVQQSRLQQVIRIGYGDPHCSAKISEILSRSWQNIPTSLPSPCAGSDGQQFKPPPARPARPCHRDAGRDLRGRGHHPSDACSMTPSPASCAMTILWCRHSQERLPGREAFPPKMSGTVGRFYLFPPIS